MPTAPVNGIDLYYDEQGEGPALVFCHGVGGNHMSWWQQVPFFSTQFRCITLDHRGFCNSPLPEEGPYAEAFADDLAALLDHLGVGEVFLVGQSMGGRTVLNFAKRQPERVKALVMAATLSNIRTPELDRLRREVRDGQPKDRLRLALSERIWRERPHLGYLYKVIRDRNPERPRKFLWRDNVPGTTAEDIAGISTPVLFVVGEEDRIAPPEVARKAFEIFPNASWLEVPKAGHSVYFERPEVFNPVVLDFFAGYR